jgi:ribosomal-protein-alanine N-acetyltransferase
VSRIALPGEPLIDGATALRPWRDSDLGELVLACRDPEIVRWTSVPADYGEADGRAYLMSRYDAVHADASAPFAIVEAPDGRLLGSVALMRFAWEHARGEAGYWLAPEARGHGHAARALRLICEWGFETLSLERIELLAARANLASQSVAARAGFTREATLRSYMQDGHGERADMVAFGLLPGEPG